MLIHYRNRPGGGDDDDANRKSAPKESSNGSEQRADAHVQKTLLEKKPKDTDAEEKVARGEGVTLEQQDDNAVQHQAENGGAYSAGCEDAEREPDDAGLDEVITL